MDYKKLVKTAGYKADQAEYITRKLEEKQVPAAKLPELTNYFPRANTLAGVDIMTLGRALYGAFEIMSKPKPKPAKTAVNESAKSED